MFSSNSTGFRELVSRNPFLWEAFAFVWCVAKTPCVVYDEKESPRLLAGILQSLIQESDLVNEKKQPVLSGCFFEVRARTNQNLHFD